MKKYQISLLLIIFVFFIIFLVDSGNLPRFLARVYDIPFGDKVGHFILMGLLSFSLNDTALASQITDLDVKPATLVWAVSLTLAFFVTLEELSQKLFPHRAFSLLDLAFDYAGIAFFGWLALFLARKER